MWTSCEESSRTVFTSVVMLSLLLCIKLDSLFYDILSSLDSLICPAHLCDVILTQLIIIG